MSANRVLAATALLGAAVALNACGHAKEALGMAKVTPDEFRVVTKAPLTLPSDYTLRPPSPGQPRPQELQPESAARLALLQTRGVEQRSDGERLLAAKAGADKADPHAQYLADDEFGSAVAYKDKGFADRVMFWKPGAPAADVAQNQKVAAALDVRPIDPKVEAARIKELTNKQHVVIAKQAAKQKLPGL
jgi:hypothetical protein